MLDLRIVVEKKDVEKLTRALASLPLESEYGISVTSIITSPQSESIIKASWGCDILLLGVQKEEFLNIEDVGNIERIDVTGDFEKTKSEIHNAVLRSALHALKAINKVRELRQVIKEQKENEARLKEELQKAKVAFIEAEGIKEKMGILETDSEALRQKIAQLEADVDYLNEEKRRLEEEKKSLHEKAEKTRKEASQKKELDVFRLEELWDDISEDLPPSRQDIEAAINRLALHGKLFYTLGFIAAPSREEALDLLRIVSIAEDLKEK